MTWEPSVPYSLFSNFFLVEDENLIPSKFLRGGGRRRCLAHPGAFPPTNPVLYLICPFVLLLCKLVCVCWPFAHPSKLCLGGIGCVRPILHNLVLIVRGRDTS